MALLGLLADDARAQRAAVGRARWLRGRRIFPPKAKRVVFLFMHGGVSHVDSFDHKPKLTELNGRPLPFAKPKFEFAPTGNLLASPWKFQTYGQSGIEVSELFPQIGSRIDDICVIRSMNGGDQVSHGPALLNMNTGSGVFARPSLGAWTLYGLGTENQNLPGLHQSQPVALSRRGAELRLGVSAGQLSRDAHRRRRHEFQRRQAFEPDARRRSRAAAIAARSACQPQPRPSASGSAPTPQFEARIAAFEMAFRMQSEAPQVMDLSRETAATQALYGVGGEPTDEYGRQCLLARRCLEAGVRFVQVNFSYPRNYWDAHGDLRNNHTTNAKKVDQPIAAFLTDLKSRGLLDDTLVIFGTEFGRTPAAQGTDGRDHHPHAFSIWMAGGGVRGGMAYGQTDEYGYYVAENKVTMPDFHATILHLLGLGSRAPHLPPRRPRLSPDRRARTGRSGDHRMTTASLPATPTRFRAWESRSVATPAPMPAGRIGRDRLPRAGQS